MQRRVTGEIPAIGEGQAGDKPGRPAAGQMAHISVSEGAGQEDMGNDFPLQGNERETAACDEQGQPDGEQTERVEDSRLGIGQEGVAAVGVGVPQGQPPGPPLLGFKAGESVELINKVAGGESGPVSRIRSDQSPMEEERQRRQKGHHHGIG